MRQAGVPEARLADVLVQGLDADTEFVRAILGNHETMDVAQARQDVVDAALELQRRAPSLETLVLECTNMQPHAASIRSATGWTVLGLTDVPALKAYVA